MSNAFDNRARQLINQSLAAGVILPPNIDGKLMAKVVYILQAFATMSDVFSDAVAAKYLEAYLDGFNDGASQTAPTP